MSKPLFLKELRETWWMGLAALVVLASLVLDVIGVELGPYLHIQWKQHLRDAPFLRNDFAPTVGMITFCLGSALGLWQTLTESAAGTWSFLLHRPISRRRIVVTKLLAGGTVMLAGVGLPLLAYLLWAMWGSYVAPFELWMTENTFRFWLAGSVAYPAAFLCGIRPGRVYVSRLWPTVPALLIFAAQLEFDFVPTARWCLMPIGIALLLPSIVFAARNRDYA